MLYIFIPTAVLDMEAETVLREQLHCTYACHKLLNLNPPHMKNVQMIHRFYGKEFLHFFLTMQKLQMILFHPTNRDHKAHNSFIGIIVICFLFFFLIINFIEEEALPHV